MNVIRAESRKAGFRGQISSNAGSFQHVAVRLLQDPSWENESAA